MQHFSILADCKNKSINRYGKVLLSQSWWVSTEYLDKKDLIKIYFILGSTRKYDPKKDHPYELDADKLISPHIKIMKDRNIADSMDSIAWDYDKNSGDGMAGEGSMRYYIDQKHAEMLYDLYDKYNHLEKAM